jgi:transcriptional regulator with XRE-family HTH domain
MGRPARKPADRDLIVSMGERLRWVRDVLGKTQSEIADEVGVHQSTWSLYERGLRWPDQFEAIHLIAKLKISRQYLLEGSLDGVARNLAILLAAHHPELADSIRTDDRTDTVQA